MLLSCLVVVLLASVSHGDMTTVYVGTWSSNVYVLDLNTDTGALLLRDTVNVSTPSWLTLNSKKTYLYTTNEQSGKILAYKIEKDTQDLTYINTVESHGGSPCYLTIDSTDKHLLVANYGDSFGTFGLQVDGSVGSEPIQIIKKSGRGPKPRQGSSHPHEFTFDTSQKYAFLVDLGLDKVFQYLYNIQSGEVTPNPNGEYVEVEAGSGPRHMAFNPNGKYAYVLNELANTLVVLDYDSTKGTLSPKQIISSLPEGVPSNDNAAAEVEVSSDGKFVYASNRNLLSGPADTIAIFQVEEDGRLSVVDYQSVAPGPRHFALYQDLVLVPNQNANRVQVFRRDASSGKMNLIHVLEGLPSPTCVKIF